MEARASEIGARFSMQVLTPPRFQLRFEWQAPATCSRRSPRTGDTRNIRIHLE